MFIDVPPDGIGGGGLGRTGGGGEWRRVEHRERGRLRKGGVHGSQGH